MRPPAATRYIQYGLSAASHTETHDGAFASMQRSMACVYLGELAYWRMVPYRPGILPGLVQCAASSRADERSSAQYAFANFGASASGAESLLTEAVRTNSDPTIQLELNQVLKSIPTGVGVNRRAIGPAWPTNAGPER